MLFRSEDLNTHKLYIGKCVNLLNRSNQYTLVYRKFINGELLEKLRPIENAIISEGISNFRMYPIAITDNRSELSMLERKYVIKYNTLSPSGYNEALPSGYDKSHYNKAYGAPQTISAKIAKSKLVACINQETKDFIVSVGMKIFGDFIGSSKDQVKNCAKRGIKHRGYHIVYLNNFDRELIKNKMFQRYDSYYAIHFKDPENDKNGYKLTKNFNEYLTAVSFAETLIDEQSAEFLIENGYTCRFLSYPYSEDSDSLFELININRITFPIHF